MGANCARCPQGVVSSIAFSPDGKILASDSGSRPSNCGMSQLGAKQVHYTGHADNVQSVAFSPNRKMLVGIA